MHTCMCVIYCYMLLLSTFQIYDGPDSSIYCHEKSLFIRSQFNVLHVRFASEHPNTVEGFKGFNATYELIAVDPYGAYTLVSISLIKNYTVFTLTATDYHYCPYIFIRFCICSTVHSFFCFKF